MKSPRHLDESLIKHFSKYQQAIVLLGARQVGKTTILKRQFPDAQYLLVDNEQTKQALETYDINIYKQILGQSPQLIIDELHLLSDPGRAVKIIYDQMPGIKLVVTGSSSLHIKNKTTESMAGRKIDYHLFPLTFSEYLVQMGIESELNRNILDHILGTTKPSAKIYSQFQVLSQVLRFGLYPELVNLGSDTEYLSNLADSAVFRDIIELNLIDNKSKAANLLKLLAYQIGNLVNYTELARKLQIDSRSVQRYIDIFEQSFIIYRLYPFSNNQRNETTKTPKIYFHDVGLRNAIIGNFDILESRVDAGALFENFIINEVNKIIDYQNLPLKTNYWRLKSGSEVDLVISDSSTLIGCEIKMNSGKISAAFINRYAYAKTRTITRENFY